MYAARGFLFIEIFLNVHTYMGRNGDDHDDNDDEDIQEILQDDVRRVKIAKERLEREEYLQVTNYIATLLW